MRQSRTDADGAALKELPTSMRPRGCARARERPGHGRQQTTRWLGRLRARQWRVLWVNSWSWSGQVLCSGEERGKGGQRYSMACQGAIGQSGPGLACGEGQHRWRGRGMDDSEATLAGHCGYYGAWGGRVWMSRLARRGSSTTWAWPMAGVSRGVVVRDHGGYPMYQHSSGIDGWQQREKSKAMAWA